MLTEASIPTPLWAYVGPPAWNAGQFIVVHPDDYFVVKDWDEGGLKLATLKRYTTGELTPPLVLANAAGPTELGRAFGLR